MKIEVLNHASVKISDGLVIYVDPYLVNKPYHDADYIFITHDHYDHYDEESINKVSKETTKIITPTCLENINPYLVVEPNKEYNLDNKIYFETIPSYNLGKPYHPKEKNYVGFNILLKGKTYYIMGDTDITEEAKKVVTDTCFVPIGGTYTMDYQEAAKYINTIKPKVCVPIHYGKVAGNIKDADRFKKLVSKDIDVEILINPLSDKTLEELKEESIQKLTIIKKAKDEEVRENAKKEYKLLVKEIAKRKIIEEENENDKYKRR